MLLDSIMKLLNVASDGLGVALCMSLSVSVQGQAAIASRGGGSRATLDRSTMMTKVKTSRVSREKRAPHTPTATNDIQPFQVHVSASARAYLRRRVRATRWTEKETVA